MFRLLNGAYPVIIEMEEKKGEARVVTAYFVEYEKFKQKIRKLNRVVANSPSSGDIFTTTSESPSGRLGVPSNTHSIAVSTNKNSNTSLENQGLSQTIVIAQRRFAHLSAKEARKAAKEYADGRRFYDYSLLEEIKNPAGSWNSNITLSNASHSPAVRIQNKTITFSLENQGLSETSMQAVKATLLARWNDTSLTAEQREQTRRAAVLLRVPLPVLVQPSTDFSVQNIPFDQIFLDKARFQPRDDFSEEKVQEIVQNFNPALFKPLIVWKDPSNGKTYVLAGHHRYEALKRMGRKTVPVVYAEGDEQKAVEIAWTENQSGRSQTSAENAKYLRKLAASGRTRAEIQAECKRLYDRSCTVALDLSALNPRGKALVDLTLLHRDTEIFKDVETMAQWIGKLRTRYPELTDAHENEVYDWLREHYKIKGRKLTMLC